jgi:hypothetical protein
MLPIYTGDHKRFWLQLCNMNMRFLFLNNAIISQWIYNLHDFKSGKSHHSYLHCAGWSYWLLCTSSHLNHEWSEKWVPVVFFKRRNYWSISLCIFNIATFFMNFSSFCNSGKHIIDCLRLDVENRTNIVILACSQ